MIPLMAISSPMVVFAPVYSARTCEMGVASGRLTPACLTDIEMFFSDAMTSAALEYKKDGFILGLGSNIFKITGSVILYGVVSAYLFGLLRIVIMGG